MSDRTSASIFADVFTMLAENPTKKNKKFANKMYEKISDYDFCISQMYIDDALIKLDLAKMVKSDIIKNFENVEYLIYKGDPSWNIKK